MLVGAAEVEVRAPGVVEKNADGAAGVHVEEERHVLVDGIGRLLPTEGVGIPHGERLAAAIERPGLIAEAKEVIGEGATLADREAGAVPEHGRGVLLQDVARGVADGQLELAVHGDAERGGVEAVVVGGDGGAAGPGAGQHGPRGVLGFRSPAPHADAQDVVAERGELERGAVRFGDEAVRVGRDLLGRCGGCREDGADCQKLCRRLPRVALFHPRPSMVPRTVLGYGFRAIRSSQSVAF